MNDNDAQRYEQFLQLQ